MLNVSLLLKAMVPKLGMTTVERKVMGMTRLLSLSTTMKEQVSSAMMSFMMS
jgi:hypothetical protein